MPLNIFIRCIGIQDSQEIIRSSSRTMTQQYPCVLQIWYIWNCFHFFLLHTCCIARIHSLQHLSVNSSHIRDVHRPAMPALLMRSQPADIRSLTFPIQQNAQWSNGSSREVIPGAIIQKGGSNSFLNSDRQQRPPSCQTCMPDRTT